VPVKVICGLQWGDEGKGKITHLLSDGADFVGRFAGGPNSGHTIYTSGQKFVFHVVPAGIFKPNVICLIGPGTVIDPVGLVDELDAVKDISPYEGRLFLSESAHLILEYHRYQDKLEELARGDSKIGTTLRGIGPTYSDKVNRVGIKAGLLKYPNELKAHVANTLEKKNKIFTSIYKAQPLKLDQVLEPILRLSDRIVPLLADTAFLARKALENNKNILLEGNQGVLLDLDHGTYPYVTSSSCTPCAGLASFGISPKYLTDVIGIVKSYQTRVGKGPMPTIQNNETGQLIRERGKEYGAATGRPRDCGWLDLVTLRYSVQIAGANLLTVTLLDVLDVFEQIKVCVAYKTPFGIITEFPSDLETLLQAEPIYETLPGWKQDISRIRAWDDLPENAKKYLKFIENQVGARVSLVSVGPEELQTIRRDI